jgi:copper chaperone
MNFEGTFRGNEIGIFLSEAGMAQTQGMMQVAVIDVKGMTCQNCARKVQEALAKVAGVARANVDIARNEAHVMFDGEQVSISRLMQAVNSTGFVAMGFTRGPAEERD